MRSRGIWPGRRRGSRSSWGSEGDEVGTRENIVMAHTERLLDRAVET